MTMTHQVKFVDAEEAHFESILNMMESFNSIDNYKFDKEVGTSNLREFGGNENLGIGCKY